MKKLRLVACAMKDEAPYILEWVAYNRVIGFDRIVIGSNDSSDGTDKILAALADNEIIHHVTNKVRSHEAPQHAFYEKLQKIDVFRDVEWLAIIDADEFINIHVGQGFLDDLILAASGADIVQLNWAVFGDNGHKFFADVPVIERFTKRIAEKNRINAGCKCLTRQPQRFERLRNHNPAAYLGSEALSVFSGGGKLRRYAPNINLTEALQYTEAENVNFKIAQINHYAIKSSQEYSLRQVRGNGGLPASRISQQRYDDKYFSLRSRAAVEDVSILRHDANLRREIDRLTDLPGVGEAVRRALAVWKSRSE